MEFEIEEEIVSQALMCPRKNECLGGQGGLYCKVSILMRGNDGGEIPLLECDKAVDCPYCEAFGKSCICNCPVRKEIYKRYRK
jgi:hypothetical protein